ncbi:MAG: hypothetical protein HYX40_07200 [Sphingobacteriales bacterium]|nr:hypothetical protein [Sphingobacteriales bacterium]
MNDKLTLAELLQLLETRTLPEIFKDWITETQLITFLGISANTLKNKRSQRKVTYSKILDSIILYYVPDIMTDLNGNMVKKKQNG